MIKNRSGSIFYHVSLSILLTSLLSVPIALIDTAMWKTHSSAHSTAIATSAISEPITVAPSPRIHAPVGETRQPGAERWSKSLTAVSSVKPRSTGAMILVSPPDQKPPQQVGGHGCSLVEAIYAANFDDNVAIDSTNPDHFVPTECVKGNGDDTIVLPAGAVFQMNSIIDDAHNYMGPTATPIIFSNITIDANGSRLERAGNLNFRAFSIGSASVGAPNGNVSGTGHLTIRNAHIKGFKAKGGNGGNGGGGGGLGAGGAIYLNGGGLAVENSTFESNSAIGGNGSISCCGAGGGGGGLSGNGGNAGNGGSFTGAGGGGGSRGNGGSGGDGQEHSEGGGGGGGGTVTSGSPAAQSRKGGFNCGGDGGVSGGVVLSGSDGDDGSCPGGGGGGGGSRFNSISGTSGNGGNGNYGGGGGGAGFDFGDGGHGGFGGGGGGSTFFATGGGDGSGGSGGDGGFGGGGGAGAGFITGGPGHGGDFAGGADKQHGGGGAGLGGAIFNDGGAVDIRNSTFTANIVTGGVSLNDDGQGRGGAIFSRNGSLTVLNSTISGNQSTSDVGLQPGGGIVVIEDGSSTSLTLRNTIIADNGADECFFTGSVTHDGSGNLIVNNFGCPGMVSMDAPHLGPLQLNPPGNTPTMAIPSNSPAFNAGDNTNCLSTDQRGVQRPQFAACDIGAYEVDCIAFAMSCPANKTQSNDPGQCGAVVTYTAPTVTGNCTPVCLPASGSFFPVGTTTVECTADIASCSFSVTVNDTQSPTVTCPSNITRSTDPNQCSTVVTYATPPANDNCPGATVVCSPASGSTFQKGTTTVTCTATDAAKNTANCMFAVTVNDMQPPTITCPASITRPTDPNQCGAVVNYPAPTVSDNCPNVGAPVCTPASGSFFPKGTTTVNCNVSDASGNVANCSFTVTVNDTQPPTITCPATINAKTATINDPCAVVNFSVTASDNCPGVTTSCSPPPGSCFALGCTTVSCTAMDTSGNRSSCAFQVCVFNVCLQDDSNPSSVFLANSFTGDYRFCCGGTTFTGKATVTRKGDVLTFQHNPTDRRVLATDDESAHRGTASLQAPVGTVRCTINDRDTRNDSPVCQ